MLESFANYNPNIDIIVIISGAVVLGVYAAIASYFENRKG